MTDVKTTAMHGAAEAAGEQAQQERVEAVTEAVEHGEVRFDAATQPIVRIKNLSKAFDDNVVLRDINLDVWRGEVVVVLGPSGSGDRKSVV